MNLTGNPFVDVGLGIAATRAGHKSVQELRPDDLKESVRALHENIERLKKLKVLSSFWVNNPFMGKNDTPKTREKFEAFLDSVATGSQRVRPGSCQICGRSPVLIKDADRCWFPLAASRDSDPCTLPGLGGKIVCPECMAAALVLPLGCRSCPDGPYFVHVTDAELQANATREGVKVLNAALAANARQIIGNVTRLRGRVALLDVAIGSALWDHSQPDHIERIPGSGATMMSFNNSGTAPCLYQLHLPAQALQFFGALTEAGVRNVFMDWAWEALRFKEKTRRALVLEGLCDHIEERRSLAPLVLALVRRRKDAHLRKDELKVLQIYENIALQKPERFEAFSRVARKLRQMPGRYSSSFIKQLGNLGSKKMVLELLKDFCRKPDAGLKLTIREVKAIHDAPQGEAASLLYLLCIAVEEEGDQ